MNAETDITKYPVSVS